eukprot:scaffold22638_cov138-Cylindrotheca_fusiformis.AAC.16
MTKPTVAQWITVHCTACSVTNLLEGTWLHQEETKACKHQNKCRNFNSSQNKQRERSYLFPIPF